MYNEIGVRTNMLQSIEFRSKFVKQIQNLPEETQEGLKKVAIRFVNDENDDKCLDILWRMTYDPETALNMLGISIENDAILDDEAEKNIQIPYVLAKNFRNELRTQRKKIHPEFMEIYIPDGCKETFESFLKESADPILATATCNHCNKVYGDFTDEEISRILFLLESPTEANYFGGIRSLKFGYAQTVCLKKYAYHIHDYLEGLWYEKESKEAGNMPMAITLKKWKEIHEESMKDASESEAIPEDVKTVNASTTTQSYETSEVAEPCETKSEGETTESVELEEVTQKETFSEMLSEEPLFCELLATAVVLLVKKIVRNYCGNDSVKTSRLVAQIRAELNSKENWNTK